MVYGVDLEVCVTFIFQGLAAFRQLSARRSNLYAMTATLIPPRPPTQDAHVQDWRWCTNSDQESDDAMDMLDGRRFGADTRGCTRRRRTRSQPSCLPGPPVIIMLRLFGGARPMPLAVLHTRPQLPNNAGRWRQKYFHRLAGFWSAAWLYDARPVVCMTSRAATLSIATGWVSVYYAWYVPCGAGTMWMDACSNTPHLVEP